MSVHPQATGQKSLHRQVFEHFLRTGRRSNLAAPSLQLERKFNPYHDPENGQFTFAPGGSRSGIGRRSPPREGSAPVAKPSAGQARLTLANYKPNPRARIGGNQRRPSYDPMTLAQTFPGLRHAPGGAIIALADNALDITGPARRLTTDLADAEAKSLIKQIRQVDPEFRYDRLGPPTTLEGQINEIRNLRMHRATARYNKLGDDKPLQVEVLVRVQASVDRAYAEGVNLADAGRLKPQLSRNEAISNYIDRTVRKDLQQLFALYGIEQGAGKPVRVVGREYNTSGTDRTYRIPDARVGQIAYDFTIARKLPSTPQVRGFFQSDFRPDAVIIVRPSQLGSGSTYGIKKPGR